MIDVLLGSFYHAPEAARNGGAAAVELSGRGTTLRLSRAVCYNGVLSAQEDP